MRTALLTILILLFSHLPLSGQLLPVGDHVPMFTGVPMDPDDGSIWSLEHHIGKVILLQFAATTDLASNQEVPQSQLAFEQRYPEALFEMVQINMNFSHGNEYILAYWDSLGVTFPILDGWTIDPPGIVYSSLFAGVVPHNVLISPAGTVLGYWISPYLGGEFEDMQGVIQANLGSGFPPAIEDLRVFLQNDSLVLNWTPLPGATSYNVYLISHPWGSGVQLGDTGNPWFRHHVGMEESGFYQVRALYP